MVDYRGYSFEYHPKFKKEFNNILKRHQCPTLKDDFKLFIDTLIVNLKENQSFPEHICVYVAGLDSSVRLPAFVVKKFRCKKINRGVNSGFRFTFVFDSKRKRFIFVEFYIKNVKKVEDKNRINDLFKKPIKVQNELYEGEQDFLNFKS